MCVFKMLLVNNFSLARISDQYYCIAFQFKEFQKCIFYTIQLYAFDPPLVVFIVTLLY